MTDPVLLVLDGEETLPRCHAEPATPAESVATSANLDRPEDPSSVSLADLQTAFKTLLHVHDAITDLKARCLSVADIENANRMIRTLEARLNGYKSACERLTDSLREAERRTRVYKRRCEEADAKLVSLQRTISLRLMEHLIEEDVFGPVPRNAPEAPPASPGP